MTLAQIVAQFFAEVAGQEGALPLQAAIERMRQRIAAREGEGGTR